MVLQKLTCNLDAELIAKVDAYAKTYHITRTSAVAVLLSQALRDIQNQQDKPLKSDEE